MSIKTCQDRPFGVHSSSLLVMSISYPYLVKIKVEVLLVTDVQLFPSRKFAKLSFLMSDLNIVSNNDRLFLLLS